MLAVASIAVARRFNIISESKIGGEVGGSKGLGLDPASWFECEDRHPPIAKTTLPSPTPIPAILSQPTYL